MSDYGVFSSEKYEGDKVHQSRKAAEREIAILEAEGNLIREKKEAILSIYEANYQAKELLAQAESARMSAASASILDFMAKYNIYMEQSLQIISLYNSEAFKNDAICNERIKN